MKGRWIHLHLAMGQRNITARRSKMAYSPGKKAAEQDSNVLQDSASTGSYPSNSLPYPS